MKNVDLIQLIAYLAALVAASVLAARGVLDPHVVAVVIGAAIPGPASSLFRRTNGGP
jgi:hypothetical protein